MPQFSAVERLFTLEGKIFAPFLTHLSSRHFRIVMLYCHLNGEIAVQIGQVAVICLTNNDVILSVVMH